MLPHNTTREPLSKNTSCYCPTCVIGVGEERNDEVLKNHLRSVLVHVRHVITQCLHTEGQDKAIGLHKHHS